MPQTILALIRDDAILAEAVQYLVTEYGMQDADIRVRHQDEAGPTSLSVEVNDDEAGEIGEALVAMGAVMEAPA